MRLKRKLAFVGIFLALAVFIASSASAFSTSTSSYSVDSYHQGTAGSEPNTTSYSSRATTTYQQAGGDGNTSSYSFNSGWFNVSFGVTAQEVRNVTINEMFFSNDSIFNFSNVFNSSAIIYDMNLTYIGSNCTAQTGNVSNVTFRLFNVEDNTSYINTTIHTFNVGDLYVLNSSFVIRDSGNWTLYVTCTGSGGNPETNTTMWDIAWGTIQVNLVQPTSDIVVQIYKFFTFSANATCSGGECGTVSVTLDPEDSEITKSCEKDCSIEIIEECVEETKEICENIETEVCNKEEKCSEECVIGEGGKVCEEVCETIEVCENITEEQCKEVTEPVCSSVEREICKEVNCIEIVNSEKGEGESEERGGKGKITTGNQIAISKIKTEEIPFTNITIQPKANETLNESIEIILKLGSLTSKIILDSNVGVLSKDMVMPKIEEGGIEIDIPEIKQKPIETLNEISEEAEEAVEKSPTLIAVNENKDKIAKSQGIIDFEFNTPIIALELSDQTSASVELPKLRNEAVNMIVKCDDWNFKEKKCNSEWDYYFDALVDFRQGDSKTEFRVRSFSAYAGGNYTGGETSWLIIWDENDIGMPNAATNTSQIKIVNETVKFFADYRLSQNGTKLADADCSIAFSDRSGNMTFNTTFTYYLYERNFTSVGAYAYTVNCIHPSYTNLSANDSIVIQSNTNATKGVVSTVTGAVPFYTTDNNPQTCTLRGGEYCNVSWQVNATGILGKIYEFFVESTGTNSSHVDVQISANDTTNPVFVFAAATPSAVINGSDVTINANVEDNIQVSSVWANISLPDNSSVFISSLPFVYTTNGTQLGIHTITFYANDTSGNNASTIKTFTAAVPINFTMTVNVTVGVGSNISAEVIATVYVAGTREALSSTNVNGSEAILLPNVPVDLEFNTTFDKKNFLSTMFEFNLTESINGSIEFSNPSLSEFLVTYGIDTDFRFTNAQVTTSYANTSFSNEDNLQLHKCSNFTVSSGVCFSGFNDVTSDSVTTQDKDNDRFIYSTTSFSGFGIKEVTPSTPPSGGGGGGGGAAIAPIAPAPSPKPEPSPITPAIPEQLFDISLSLDESLIQDSDELSAVVTFESFGIEPTPVELTFIILDDTENEVYREEDSITVEVEEVLRKSFKGLNLPEGKYTLVLNTLYNIDVFDEFRQEFEIAKKEESFIEKIFSWIKGNKGNLGVIIVGILIIVGIIYSTTRLRKKK